MATRAHTANGDEITPAPRTLTTDAGACISDGRLRWAEGVALVPELMAEMDAINARKTPAGNVIMEHVVAREAPNDDLVFALCLSLFGHHADWAR